MRTRAALVVCGVLLPLLAPTAAIAGPGITSTASVSKAQAKKLAKAGVLTKSDMKGYKVEASGTDSGDAKDEKAFYRCIGAKLPTFPARNAGYSYTKGPVTIDSSADVVSTVSAAKADFKAIKAGKAPGCFKKRFASALNRAGFTTHSLKVSPVSVKVKNSDVATGFRILADLRYTDMMFRFDSYFVAVLVGQTEISVSPSRFDGGKPSLKQSTDLAAKVAKRVRVV